MNRPGPTIYGQQLWVIEAGGASEDERPRRVRSAVRGMVTVRSKIYKRGMTAWASELTVPGGVSGARVTGAANARCSLCKWN